jgi:hypothetical protein
MAQVTAEMALAGHFPGGQLGGFADLVMHKGRSQYAIVDMKWSGMKKFPDKLKSN